MREGQTQKIPSNVSEEALRHLVSLIYTGCPDKARGRWTGEVLEPYREKLHALVTCVWCVRFLARNIPCRSIWRRGWEGHAGGWVGGWEEEHLVSMIIVVTRLRGSKP